MSGGHMKVGVLLSNSYALVWAGIREIAQKLDRVRGLITLWMR